MADYNSQYAGQTIDTAVGKVINADEEPTAGSSQLVRSGGVASALALKAPLNSPALTGNPTAPTQAENNNSTRLATTAFVQRGLSAKQDTLEFDNRPRAGSPNPVTSAGIRAAIDAIVIDHDGLAPINSPAFTGTPTAPTPPQSNDSTRLATTEYVQSKKRTINASIARDYDAASGYENYDIVLRNDLLYQFVGITRKAYRDSNQKVYRDASGKVYLAPSSSQLSFTQRVTLGDLVASIMKQLNA